MNRDEYSFITVIGVVLLMVAVIGVMLAAIGYITGRAYNQQRTQYLELQIRQLESQQHIDRGRVEIICNRAPAACQNLE